jgi:N,N'-diacetyllegionaminate synthase
MFIISEIFPQHSGDLETAEQMILQSKMGGANAVKVQLYTATQFGKERAYLELSFEGLKRLKEYADNLNIALFATAFTHDRLEWCLDLKLPYLKVAARMHDEMPDLVDEIMKQKIKTFVSVPEHFNIENLKLYDHAVYLYCILKYPTRLDECSFPDFNNSIFKGLSDHTLGNSAALYASSHGASYLEKHFTLSYSFQYETEKAHLGSMTMNDLMLIRKTSKEFEIIRDNISKK